MTAVHKYTKKLPCLPGWYWFRADENSPTPTGFLSMGLGVVVFVGALRIYGDPPSRLVVRFPSVTYGVESLGGYWSDRLEEPIA